MATAKVSFWQTTVGKTIKTAIYLAVSSALGYLVTSIANEPLIFGVYLTPIINLVIVFVKNLIDKNVKNI